MMQKTNHRVLIAAYLAAKLRIIREGFGHEIDWQSTRDLSSLTESDFLREAAWVILCCGMRERVVRQLFHNISLAFLDWESAVAIVHNRKACEARATKVFRHRSKIAAITSMCEKVAAEGFSAIRLAIQTQGVDFLRKFEFIGPITSYHLAKNIGLEVAKPDRHLTRITKVTNSNSPYELCRVISKVTGDKISVVDLVLWRYATLEPEYLSAFSARGMTQGGTINRRRTPVRQWATGGARSPVAVGRSSSTMRKRHARKDPA